MAFFRAKVLTKDGLVVAEEVQVWLTFFRLGPAQRWDGSFGVPATTLFSEPTYQLQLYDGRQGTITNINARISDENIVVYFEGRGPLQHREQPVKARTCPPAPHTTGQSPYTGAGAGEDV